MGIYGALSTAVSALRAQSQALENISGNIANSQTTAYKRTETDFVDMIADAPVKRQVAGSVMAQSRATNNDQGDITTVSNETFIALNSDGFFVVESSSGNTDGEPTFSGANYYTRRGDFEIDKDGLLVNGAGYYLKGMQIDPKTGNASGSVPQVIKLSNAFLPAQQSTRINYQANLPQVPKNGSYDASVPGSELMTNADYAVPATATGTTGLTGTANMSTIATAGNTFTMQTSTGTPVTFQYYDGAAGTFVAATPGNQGIDIRTTPTPVSINTALADMQTKFRANGGTGAESATIGLVNGQITMTLGTNDTASLTTTNPDTLFGLPTAATTVNRTVPTNLATIPASEDTQFQSDSVDGGSITLYAKNGAAATVVMRWAKVDSAATGTADTWNLYYMSDSTATGTEPMWTRVNQDYTFGSDGSMAPPVTTTTITGLTVNGVVVGDVELEHGVGGMTQQADVEGQVSTSTLKQNGYAPGEYVSVSISDSGRVVASYSNGESIDMAQVVTAEFNAVNQLKRMDGGVYAATTESGEPMLDNSGGGIVGGSLEASNADISDEFTKLIVTQQAYSAGTKIITAADEMLQEALNMIR